MITEFLYKLIGGAAQYYIMLCLDFLGVAFYYVTLSYYKKRRKLYLLRLLAVFLVQFLICIPLAYLRFHFNNNFVRILNYTVTNAVYLCGLFFCHDEKPSEIFLCFTGIYASRNLSSNMHSLFMIAAGIDINTSISFFHNEAPAALDWVIYWLIEIVLFLVIYLFIRTREKLQDTESGTLFAVLLAFASYGTNTVISAFVSEYAPNDFYLNTCCRILLSVVSALLLVMRAGLLNGSRIQRELQTTEQLLYQEKKHYAEMRDNINMINIKCHDIKHQLEAFHDKLTDSELTALQDAIRIYDSNIKTGNEILDTILYQKQLYSEKNGIELSCLADGALLAFISPTDLYSLLSNAIDNAIEAVTRLKENKKRVISVTVRKKEEQAVIEVTNYFDPSFSTVAATSKEDKTHHGYGIKSMKYLAEKYRGNLVTETEDDIFYLHIYLPLGAK